MFAWGLDRMLFSGTCLGTLILTTFSLGDWLGVGLLGPVIQGCLCLGSGSGVDLGGAIHQGHPFYPRNPFLEIRISIVISIRILLLRYCDTIVEIEKFSSEFAKTRQI